MWATVQIDDVEFSHQYKGNGYLTAVEPDQSVHLHVHIKSIHQNFQPVCEGERERIESKGEITDDLFNNLFKAYQFASDVEFVRYIKTKRDQYDNGYNLSPDELITSSLKTFEILRKEKNWNSMSPEQERILTLFYIV